jgi:dihydrofolate reductase
MQASVFVGTSLDGFMARPDHSFDFLPADGGEPHGYREFMATVDALVIGRKTYEVVLGMEPWPYGEKSVIVLSSSALKPPPPNAKVSRMSGEPSEIWAELEAKGYRHIYVDGGITIQRFLAAGLIQRIVITRVPVLIGSGIPLFGSVPHDFRLQHVATRSFRDGLVQSEYHADEPPGEEIRPLW